MTESPDELRRLAESLMRRREWSAAAEAFERIPRDARDVATDLKHRFTRNLAALQQHRPVVYDLITSLPAGQYSVGVTPSGKPSVHCRRPDGSVVSLSGGPDPLAAVSAALPKLYQQTPAGEGIAVCGLGDGYLVQLLAQQPPRLFMDKQQAVFLLEPEPQVLLQCLMIHDYTGAAGPIEQARFYWFVGAGWEVEMRRTLLDDLYLPCPSVTVAQGFDTQAILAGLRSIMQRLAERDARLAADINRHYEPLTPSSFAERIGAARGRAPRVLLLTTRLSTVLQYSTRDAAAAFGRLGWEARVIIEPSPHHRVLRSSIAGALAEFKPDLVFQIDHLRHEHQGLFPENLPFACWIQDHLPHLASREAGLRVGELDFVLTDAIATYVDKFDYPSRQCIPLPKLVVRAEPAEIDAARVDDIVFVSNASGSPEAMLGEALTRYARSPHTEELIIRCCRSMIETYEGGGSLPTYNDVCAVLRQTLDGLALSLPPEGFDVLARWLTHPFNDALYRQQALRWAADVARGQGLSLALYGKGWDAHPEFAQYARGPVEYGERLRCLTRGSRINLQIVPYLCLHQRLLDGLMAGGFFLVRAHPADVAPAALLRHVHTHGDVPSQELSALVEQSRFCLCTTGDEDVVAMVRSWQEAGQLTHADGPLPMFGEVSFNDRASLAARVEAYVASPDARAAVVACQRRSIGARLSYDAGIRRVVGRIAELLEPKSATVVGRKAA